MSVADRAGYSLRADGSVYVWGFNYENFIETKPQVLIDIKEDTKLSKLKVAGIWCRGNQRHIVDREGKASNFIKEEPSNQWKLAPIDFGFKNIVRSIALSYNFAIFLNTQGHLYGYGDNSKGQLGLGYTSIF